MQVCCTQNLCPCGSPLLTRTSTGDTQTQSVSVSVGSLEFIVHCCILPCLEPSWALQKCLLNVLWMNALGCSISGQRAQWLGAQTGSGPGSRGLQLEVPMGQVAVPPSAWFFSSICWGWGPSSQRSCVGGVSYYQGRVENGTHPIMSYHSPRVCLYCPSDHLPFLFAVMTRITNCNFRLRWNFLWGTFNASLSLWLWRRFSTYDSTCQIAQEIAEKVQQRNQYERNGENTTKVRPGETGLFRAFVWALRSENPPLSEAVGVTTCVCESLSHVWLFVTPCAVGPPDSSVHGILQARILEWVAIGQMDITTSPFMVNFITETKWSRASL